MKKLALILSLLIVVSCVGCGSSDASTKSDTPDSSDTGSTEAAASEDSDTGSAEATVSDESSSDESAADDSSAEDTSATASQYNTFINDYTSFEVTSTNLNNGVWDDVISYTDKGSNKSPQLQWNAVDGAALYVIIMDDPDAGHWRHWKSDNVTETSLAEGWAPSSDYVGPYPPSGATHTYEIYVVALKAPVERVKGSLNVQNQKFEENFKALDIDAEGNSGNIIAVGRLSGTFSN